MSEENNVNKVRAVQRTKLYLEDSLSEGNILYPHPKTIEGIISLDKSPHYELVITKGSDFVETLRRRGVSPSGLIEYIEYQLKKDSDGIYLEERVCNSFPEGTKEYIKYDKILTERGIVE